MTFGLQTGLQICRIKICKVITRRYFDVLSITMKVTRTLPLVLLVTGCLFLFSCTKSGMDVETGNITNVYSSTADIAGHILSVGDGIKQYGHCYSQVPGPTVSDDRTVFSVAIGIGAYSSHLVNLEPGTKYYVKAYSTNGSAVVYGKELSFTTAASDR